MHRKIHVKYDDIGNAAWKVSTWQWLRRVIRAWFATRKNLQSQVFFNMPACDKLEQKICCYRLRNPRLASVFRIFVENVSFAEKTRSAQICVVRLSAIEMRNTAISRIIRRWYLGQTGDDQEKARRSSSGTHNSSSSDIDGADHQCPNSLWCSAEFAV